MSTDLQIKLFATPTILQNGVSVTGFISNKAPALIYMLAGSGQPQTRNRLATLLWSNSDETYAKKKLAQCLIQLA